MVRRGGGDSDAGEVAGSAPSLTISDQSLPKSALKVVIDSSIIKNKEQKTAESQGQPENQLQPSIITKINAGYFRICISLAGQALLWKTITELTDVFPPLHKVVVKIPSIVCLVLWCLTLVVLVSVSLLYIMRCIFHFHMVQAEFSHHVGVNYLFAPWISWLLLLQSAPPTIFPKTQAYVHLWWPLIIPVVVLDVKVYGQWFTTEKRFLSMAANPTSQISVIGNLVGAHAATQMGWKESGVCLFTLGMTHYLVVFITLYQRLNGSKNHLPAGLRPVFFLFVAAPSMAAMAWESIKGEFDIQCKMFFFLSLFLFASLATRPKLFKKPMKRFSVAWWAFSFPITFLALASISYAQQVQTAAAIGLAIVLSVISVILFVVVFVLSILNINLLLRHPILTFTNDVGASNV